MSDESNLALQPATLKRIQETAVKAAGGKGQIEILEPAAERGERYIVVAPGGAWTYQEPRPKRREHVVGSLDQVPAYVRYAQHVDAKAQRVVWFDEDGVAIVLDDRADSHRCDTAELEFVQTPEFRWMVTIATSGCPQMTQKDLIKLLRTKLSACETAESIKLLSVVRDLAAKTRTDTHGRVNHGQESIGRDIENEVTSAIGEVPEETLFQVRPFTDPLLTSTYPIQCAVEIDPVKMTIELFPRPEDITAALDNSYEFIGEYLRRECGETPVFYGSP